MPFVGGREMAMESGLPLGLAAGVSYAESRFKLGDEQLTLVTDGVVEARGKNGDLFGFERTAAIADETAERIAEAALEFGQEDDVTVLTVKRVAVEALV
jgi:serine phosphatase RsbU (regulator of sigma subunit)